MIEGLGDRFITLIVLFGIGYLIYKSMKGERMDNNIDKLKGMLRWKK